MIVALVALCSSLTGGAIAATLVTGGDIRNGSITKKDLHKNSVNTKKVKNKTLKAVDFGPGQLKQGVQGIPGLKGEKGDDGPRGPSSATAVAGQETVYGNAFTTIMSVSLKSGSWVVMAKGQMDNQDLGGPEASSCRLRLGPTTVDQLLDVTLPANGDPGDAAPFALIGASALTSDGQARLECQGTGDGGVARDPRITVIQVDSLPGTQGPTGPPGG
jgi:hypothetical protein